MVESNSNYQKLRRQNNTSHVQAIDRESYEKNKEARLEKAKRYAEENKEKIKKYQKEYYMKNKDKLIEKANMRKSGKIDKDRIKKLLEEDIVGIYRLNYLVEVLLKNAKKYNLSEVIDKYDETCFEVSNGTILFKNGNDKLIESYSNILDATNVVKNDMKKLLDV